MPQEARTHNDVITLSKPFATPCVIPGVVLTDSDIALHLDSFSINLFGYETEDAIHCLQHMCKSHIHVKHNNKYKQNHKDDL